MASKVLSIEIGQQTTKICEIEYQRKNPHVYGCIVFDTPVGVIEDGCIRDKIAFATVLSEKLKEAGMKNDKVIFTIASTKIANREAFIPFVKENRIQDIVDANASDYFPVNIEDYSITYSIIEKVTEEEKKIKLLVLAAPNSLIRSYYELADILKLNIVAIDYVSNSSYQFVRKQVPEGVNLVIQINDQGTIVNLMENGNLLLQRTIPYGVSTVAETVIQHRYYPANNYKEAVELLAQQSLILQSFESMEFGRYMEEEETVLRLQAAEEVTASLRGFIGNINRIIDYYSTKYPNKAIDYIYIAGEGIQLNGIVSLVQTEVGVKVKLLEKLDFVTFGKAVAKNLQWQSRFISCIGASIAPIGFTSKEANKKKKQTNENRKITVLFSGSVAVAVVLLLVGVVQYQMAIQERAKLDSKIAAIEDIESIYNEYITAENEYLNIEALHNATKVPTESFLNLLSELEEKLPKTTVVTSLNITTTELTLNLKCDTYTTASKLVEQLKTISNLTNVNVNTISETVDDNGVAEISFVATCQYSKE